MKEAGVLLSLRRPAKLSIEINSGIDDNLHLFVGRPEIDPPRPGDAEVLYYGPKCPWCSESLWA